MKTWVLVLVIGFGAPHPFERPLLYGLSWQDCVTAAVVLMRVASNDEALGCRREARRRATIDGPTESSIIIKLPLNMTHSAQL